MRNHLISGRLFITLIALFGVLVFASETTFGQSKTKITIVNVNLPGEGFNDPTPTLPVGGNTGTTLGQQRLKNFKIPLFGGIVLYQFLQRPDERGHSVRGIHVRLQVFHVMSERESSLADQQIRCA